MNSAPKPSPSQRANQWAQRISTRAAEACRRGWLTTLTRITGRILTGLAATLIAFLFASWAGTDSEQLHRWSFVLFGVAVVVCTAWSTVRYTIRTWRAQRIHARLRTPEQHQEFVLSETGHGTVTLLVDPVSGTTATQVHLTPELRMHDLEDAFVTLTAICAVLGNRGRLLKVMDTGPLDAALTMTLEYAIALPEQYGEPVSDTAQEALNRLLMGETRLKDICRASKALSKTARLAMPTTAIYSALENIPVHEAYRHLQTRLRISKTKETA